LFHFNSKSNNALKTIGSGLVAATVFCSILAGGWRYCWFPVLACSLAILLVVLSWGLISMPFALWALAASVYWVFRQNTLPSLFRSR